MRHHILFHVNNVSHMMLLYNTTKTFPLQYLFEANVNVFCFIFVSVHFSSLFGCMFFFYFGRNIYFELISISLYVELGEQYNED